MEQYELYCLADSFFYDKLDQRQSDASDFSLVRRPTPDGWIRHDTDSWMYYGLTDAEPLPAQGWKIHISARLDDAEKALAVVWDYCVPRGIAFKYLRGSSVLVMYNSKSASRGSSGKLVTIYPRDEEELQLVLKELDELLHGVKGPYILSDLRYGEGPLFVRYGGFADQRCLAENGQRVLAIEDGEGRLIPDVRGATFSVPGWITLPAFLEPHLAVRNAVTTTGLPYRIESVLHFSNGGGVYLARDSRTGERVVLKEARPHAGLDAAGRDATARLRHERDVMERLAGLEVTPALLDYFELGDHEFLVQEFVDGNPLQRQLVQRYPLTRATCTEEDLESYTRWVVDVLGRVGDAVGALHERGVVFGDLHPNNILLTREDDRLVLIDFEVATFVADDARAALAHPAFGAPRDRRGVAADRYALACLSLGLFAPQSTIMLLVHRTKAAQLAELVSETFPVPADVMDQAVQTILPAEAGADPRAAQPGAAAVPPPPLHLPGVAPWPEVRAAMHRAILASATPDRDDRLFPGDVAQFEPGGGINFANGAAGVLYTLAETGADRFPEHEAWLAERALRPVSGNGLGLYDGLHGVAYVLDRLGHRQTALDTVDICLREKWEKLGLDLYSGLSGFGLNLLHLGPEFAEVAARIVDICADRLGGPQDVPELSGGDNPRAGLMHGSSGPALLFLHAYERTGEVALLDKAADALRQDLRRCIRVEDGSLQVNQGWRYLPYLGEGSVGIGLVLARYLIHRPDEDLTAALSDLRLIARSQYFVQSGLFTGRAGIIAALGMGLRDAQTDPDPLLTDQIRGLRWHAMSYGGGLAFPGDQLLRLSMDFATGTAGVLFALSTALPERPLRLPYLEPPVDTAPSSEASRAQRSTERLAHHESGEEV